METQNQLFASKATIQPGEFYLDIVEAADLLCISRADLRSRVERGLVPGHKLWHGGRFCWKFRRTELAELVAADRGTPESSIQ